MSYVSKKPGDIGFTQYAVISTMKIKSALSIVKGNFYTVNTDGYIIALTASAGVVSNASKGLFQATADSVAISGESDGDRLAQFLRLRSRVIAKASANLVVGESVEIAASLAVVSADKVQSSTTTGKKLGTIFKIFSDKIKTANDDLVYVEMFN